MMPSLIPSAGPSHNPSSIPSSIPTVTPSSIPGSAPRDCVDEVDWTVDSSTFPGRTCDDIAESPGQWCGYFGPSKGKSPLEACCACGGGKHVPVAPSSMPSKIPSTAPSTTIHPSLIPSQSPSYAPSTSHHPSIKASDIPSSAPSECEDEPDWIWDVPNNLDCPSLTTSFCGPGLTAKGMTSLEACCVCR